MAKYKEYFRRMLEVEKELFDSFKRLHDEYALNPDKYQEQFNQEGEKVLKVIHDWENKLCMQSEKGGYGNFTTSLAEKFWGEIRKEFPEIDNVGIILQNDAKPEPALATQNIFVIKKINLP
jgi:hypothetical protein